MKHWFHPARSCLPVLMATFAVACGGGAVPAGSEGAQELARQQWELTPIAGNPAGRPNYVVAIGYLNDTVQVEASFHNSSSSACASSDERSCDMLRIGHYYE